MLATAIAPQVIADTAFPGHPPNRELLEIQSRVDALFKAGKYDRAMVIYRKELAPLGDKYAQYMIGYMHLAGKGVDQDLPMAAAWYRLAAERGQQTFVTENRKLVSLLEPEQLENAERIFRELRRQYGDAALIMRLVADDLATLDDVVGGTEAFPVAGLDRRTRSIDEAYVEQLERRIRDRLEYLDAVLARDEYADAADRERLDILERRAARVIRDARRIR
ncbi:MAG: SEL1-like repeat protein [Woeseiaceae bacterium]|nr:SEL1-like repeat protein [Woeseiaceae bacterium]